MANEEHLAKLKEGVKAWNEWRKQTEVSLMDEQGTSGDVVDLSGANLRSVNLGGVNLHGANLNGADLSTADFTGADLSNANLCRTKLSWAVLEKVDLSSTDLRVADLSHSILRHANLAGADISEANLFRAFLSTADLRNAVLENTNVISAAVGATLFLNNDLSTTKGLDSIQHLSASTIDVNTIYKSQGKIPVSFLRGAGIPESFIQYMPYFLTPGAIQFYSCFISYSTKDQEFADRLYVDLQNKGVRCWFAPHDVQGGKKLHEQIDEAIRMHERLLLILSPNSMNSKWVKTEIRNARKHELGEKKRVLFPVRLASYEALRDWKLFDADEGEDLATEIREYYIPDFSEWKNHDSYRKEFEKLLRDLRMEGSKKV